MEKIHKSKRQLVQYQKEISHVGNVARASIEKSRYLSLLSELVHGQLLGKLSKMAKDKAPACEVKVHNPQVNFNDEKWNKLKRKNILGTIDPPEPKVQKTSATVWRAAAMDDPKVIRVITTSGNQKGQIRGLASQSPTTANVNRRTSPVVGATISQPTGSHRGPESTVSATPRYSNTLT